MDPRVGTVIVGRYLVLRSIGRGGFGMVYLAQEENARSPCALKILKSELAHNDDAVRRFQTEAAVLRKLRNTENIVQIFDFGQLPTSEFYMAMEYIEGRPLSYELKARRQLEINEALFIAREVAVGLREANKVGVLHRDLKPDNIILTPTRRGGGVKVLDFGIARLKEETTHLTATGFVAGTPAYMSFEQWMKKDNLDIRSDLYALGVLMYRMLTGELPFPGSSDSPVAIYEQIKRGSYKPVRHHRPNVPLDVSQLTHRLLERNRDKRPSTPDEVVAMLDALMESVPAVLTPSMKVQSGGVSASIFSKRRPINPSRPPMRLPIPKPLEPTTQVRGQKPHERSDGVFDEAPTRKYTPTSPQPIPLKKDEPTQRDHIFVATLVLVLAVVFGLWLSWQNADIINDALGFDEATPTLDGGLLEPP